MLYVVCMSTDHRAKLNIFLNKNLLGAFYMVVTIQTIADKNIKLITINILIYIT